LAVKLSQACQPQFQPGGRQIIDPHAEQLLMSKGLGALQAGEKTLDLPLPQMAKHPRQPEGFVAPQLDHVERKGVIGKQQRPMISLPPPLRAPPYFHRDVGITELGTGLAQVHILFVERRQRAGCRITGKRPCVADKFRLRLKRQPVSHFQPSPNIGLVLNAVGIIFSASIFSEPHRLSVSHRKRIDLDIYNPAITNLPRLFIRGSLDCPQVFEFRPKLFD
jgi:hypothetical protein